MKTEQPIIILGMHRSGTSMVSSLLNESGLSMGNKSQMVANEKFDNPKGFYELSSIVSLSDQILEKLGGDYRDIPVLLSKPNWMNEIDLSEEQEFARSALGSVISSNAPWGFKDPRATVLIPFWKSLYPNLKVVVCVRNPLEVAFSLSKRIYHPLPFEKGLDLWLKYYQTMEATIEDTPKLFTHYSSYFHNAAEELERVAKFSGLKIDSKEASTIVDKMVDRDLYRSVTSPSMLETWDALNPEVLELYQDYLDESDFLDSIQGSDKELYKDDWALHNLFDVSVLALDKKSAFVLTKDKEIEEYQKQIEKYQKQTEEYQKQIEESEKRIEESEKRIEESEKQIEEYQGRNEETQRSLQNTIDELNHKLAASTENYAKLRLEVDDLQRGYGFRILKKVQAVVAFFLPVDSLSRKFFRKILGKFVFTGRGSETSIDRINSEDESLNAVDFPSPIVSIPAISEVYSNLVGEANSPQPLEDDLDTFIALTGTPKVSVIIPTLNGGQLFINVLTELKTQDYDGDIEIIVVDSGSNDNTQEYAKKMGIKVISIDKSEFNHGLTRNKGISHATGSIIVLMSQDSLPGDNKLVANLVNGFREDGVAGVYARQVPKDDADPITKRNLGSWFTGRSEREIRQINDWKEYQNLNSFDKYFFVNFDNVCSAIRKDVWDRFQFYKNDFGEDIDWAQRVLEAGFKIAYEADAYVVHSHPRSYKYELFRNRLCHTKLYKQFGIKTIPTKKQVFVSTIDATRQDWKYVANSDLSFVAKLMQQVRIPFLSFASVYGQYVGANKIEKKEKNPSITKPLPGQKLKIILTAHQFFPEFSSGTEVLTHSTAKSLQAQGHEVIIFTGYPAQTQLADHERFDIYEYDGIQIFRFHYSPVPTGGQKNPFEISYNSKLTYLFFKELLRDQKPDVVHFFHLSRLSASLIDACNDEGYPTVMTPTDFWMSCPISQLKLPDNSMCDGPDKLGLNCIKHIVDINHMGKKKNEILQNTPDWILNLGLVFIKTGLFSNTRIVAFMESVSKRLAFLQNKANQLDAIIIPNQFMLSSMVRNGLKRKNYITMPYGLDLSYSKSAIRSNNNNVLRVGFIGTISEHKGVHVLVQAVKNLQYENVELKIYGKVSDFPNYVEELKDIIGNDTRIDFFGTFPNVEIGDVFSGLDVLVVPSIWYENTPLVIYSAQAAKCPVIVSDRPGMTEVIDHDYNGLVFETGNDKELTKQLERLVTEQNLLDTLSTNAKEPTTIEEYTNVLEGIYYQLL